MTDEGLARAFGFDSADLEANRLGAVTPGQQADLDERLRLRGKGRRFAMGAAAVTVVLLWVVLALVGDLSGPAAIALGAVTGVAVLAFALSLGAGHLRSRDLRAGTVSEASGPVTTEVKEIREQGQKLGDQYRVELGGVRLLVPTKDQLEAFESGRRYRVFYVADPPTHHVLSAERLG